MAEIPSDVLFLILKKLPTKTLVRFLSVSKSWHSLIKTPTFINSHKNHHNNFFINNNNKFLWKTEVAYYVMHFHNRGSKRRCTRTQLPSPPYGFDEIAAELDGLVCLPKSNNSNLLLWNPSIDTFKMIETPSSVAASPSSTTCVVGLGYNRVEEDYCVVLINHVFLPVVADATPSSYRAHVCSVANKQPSLGWKRVSLPVFEESVTSILHGCFLRDNIHWLMLRSGIGSGRWGGSIELGYAILTFDVLRNNGHFALMQLPRALKEESLDDDHELMMMNLAVIDDSLAIVQFPSIILEYWRSSAIVWKMGVYGVEESWEVLYKVNLCGVANVRLWAEEDDKVFVTTSCGKLLVLFNFSNSNNNNGGVYKGDIAISGGQAFGYEESLLLLDDGLQREEVEANSEYIL